MKDNYEYSGIDYSYTKDECKITILERIENRQKVKYVCKLSTAEYLKVIISKSNLTLSKVSKYANINIKRLCAILDGEADPKLSEISNILFACEKQLCIDSKNLNIAFI